MNECIEAAFQSVLDCACASSHSDAEVNRNLLEQKRLNKNGITDLNVHER